MRLVATALHMCKLGQGEWESEELGCCCSSSCYFQLVFFLLFFFFFVFFIPLLLQLVCRLHLFSSYLLLFAFVLFFGLSLSSCFLFFFRISRVQPIEATNTMQVRPYIRVWKIGFEGLMASKHSKKMQ